MKTILHNVKIKGWNIVKLVLIVLLAAIGEMMLPTLLSSMINKGVVTGNYRIVLTLAFVMLGITILACVINFISVKIATGIASDFGAQLRSAIFKKVQKFSSVEIDKFKTASLITRSTSDVTNVQNFLTLLLRVGILAPMMAIAGLVFSASTGGKVSVVLCISIPVLLIGCGSIVIIASKYSLVLRKKLDKINHLFLESLEGVRVVRAFNRQKHEENRFQTVNDDFTTTAKKSARITSLLMPSINVIFGMTSVCVLGLGALYISDGKMEVGSLVANSQYISMVLMSVMMLALVIMVFPTTYACAKRIEEVLKSDVSLKDGTYNIDDKKEVGCVEFKNVTFAYPSAQEPILKNISFKINKGEFVAIVGGTGRGKSSILKLIARLYDTSYGEVLVDGINVKDMPKDKLRSLIGYVPQRNVLFAGNIASNLNFGDETGDVDKWDKAVSIACAKEIVDSKSDGYQEVVSQGGTNFSGGQKQRLCIARAIMKRPEIYIFDDSFSALDVKTDRTLRNNIKENLRGATVIMVAQRISTIMEADKILVVDDGMIVAQGKHEELIRTCKLYQEIAKIQLGKEAIDHE